MSITDHDSIDSYQVARDHGQKLSIHLITGVIQWLERSFNQERNNARTLI